MDDGIVKRLNSTRKRSINIIKESFRQDKLYEKDEESEEEMPTAEEDVTAEEHDDSMAPIQGEMPEEDDSPEEATAGDTSEEESDEEEPEGEDDYVDPEGDTEGETEDTPEEDSDEYVNPLDNHFAVKHTIGDEVLLAYSNGTKSKLKGQIDGYDKEGFYRIKWSNGLTTNGITDLALAALVSHANESKCVCGGTKFVNEGNSVVCDKCGRKIRENVKTSQSNRKIAESNTDPLTLADKSRPAGKKLVRSQAAPTSTVIKPSISEAIKKALKGDKKLTEDYDDEEYEDDGDEDVFDKLRKSLDGEFWTRLPELRQDIEDLGYEVDEINSEYAVVSIEDDEEEVKTLQIPIEGTSRTMYLNFKRARELNW